MIPWDFNELKTMQDNEGKDPLRSLHNYKRIPCIYMYITCIYACKGLDFVFCAER